MDLQVVARGCRLVSEALISGNWSYLGLSPSLITESPRRLAHFSRICALGYLAPATLQPAEIIGEGRRRRLVSQGNGKAAGLEFFSKWSKFIPLPLARRTLPH